MAHNLNQVAKAGTMGVCSICLVAFGLLLLLPGAILTGVSQDSAFQSSFFSSINRGQLIAGIILLVISFIFIGIGVFFCVRICNMDLDANTSYAPGVTTTTTTTYVTQPGQPMMTSQYPGAQQGGYPDQQYPDQAQPYPGQAQPYPNETQTEPGQQYPAYDTTQMSDVSNTTDIAPSAPAADTSPPSYDASTDKS